MKILIEEYPYDAALVYNILEGIDALQNIEGKVSLNYVGYYYNPSLNGGRGDLVFILPKVLMDENDRVFTKYSPEEIIHIDTSKANDQERSFLYEFAVWIYRAIDVFQRSTKSDIVLHRQLSQMGRGTRRHTNTLLDILLSLIQFNRDNHSYITFILKNLHSGLNRINWSRTISHSNTILQDKCPVYLKPVNKKRQINFDEELLVIYFSILNYIDKTYGFSVNILPGFTLITGKQFSAYLCGRGVTRLKQIKYKYFSDTALDLWNLCYAFFAHHTEITTSAALKEYLLVKNFYVVFEAMIDELIGDSKNELPDYFKDQKDGKLVDHLYTYPGLIEADENQRTYYIGDSKYYKLGAQLGETAIYKQYTYARNIVQYNIDLWMDSHQYNPTIQLRDELTEGYNIIPNFFISATIRKDDFSYNHREITSIDNPYISFQFKDRLFDRDTLLLSRYNVNFLFVLSLYARNKQSEKDTWKEEVREQFRKEIRLMLSSLYDFYALKCKDSTSAGEVFICDHFKELQGKLFRPYANKSLYVLALEKQKGKNTKESDVYCLLNSFFEVTSIELGENPQKHLEARASAYPFHHSHSASSAQLLPNYHLEQYEHACFMVGMYHNHRHWDWISGENSKGRKMYNIRLESLRPGSLSKTDITARNPKFAILFESGHERENLFHAFRIRGFEEMSEETMQTTLYPRTPHGNYLVFFLEEEVSLGKIDLKKLLPLKLKELGFHKGTPLFLTGKELLSFKL